MAVKENNFSNHDLFLFLADYFLLKFLIMAYHIVQNFSDLRNDYSKVFQILKIFHQQINDILLAFLQIFQFPFLILLE